MENNNFKRKAKQQHELEQDLDEETKSLSLEQETF